MSSATDRLRAMLDERGVEWEALSDQQEGGFTITATRWHDGEGGLLTMFISEPHGSTWDFFWLPTPEQAIAATLGVGQAADEWGEGFRAGCDAANKASEESVEHYKAENAKLREEVEQWHRLTAGIELPEYPITEFKPKDLERENAKLWELVRDMWPHVRNRSRTCAECELPCDESDECLLYEPMRDRMHELGIEVDG